MNFRPLISIFALCAGALALPAQVVVSGYTETGNLPGNDDDYTEGAISLGFSIDFAGATYSSTYVSNNGYITFGGGSGDYTPTVFDASYASNLSSNEQTLRPIISAFFSDVDTRSSSENPNFDSGIVSWGTGTVNGQAAFQVKWDHVGEYSFVEKYNTFSLILVSRADLATGNFDVYFTYDNIAWDHEAAVAGFHNGDAENPLFFSLPGSGTEGAFLDGGTNALASASNSGSAGTITMIARNGAFESVATIVAIPEPSTYVLLALGAGLLGLTSYRRRRGSV